MEPELLRFTTAGSVDDGKSTLIGRLLHDTEAVYEDQLESVRKVSPDGLDLAFLTDGLRAEREQGITIDVAYRYFSTPRRRFIIADTPGHEQYTRNMATGASTAEAAVILLDARKGVLPQTRRHACIAWLLGIRHIVAAVNKMDLAGYRQDVFASVCRDFEALMSKLPGCRLHVIPVSALQGDNIVRPSSCMPWFTGGTLLEYLETVPVGEPALQAPFRFPVQYVIRSQDGSRGYAGQIASGSVRPGDHVLLLPSRRLAPVEAVRTYGGDLERAFAPRSVSLYLADYVDAGRGDMFASPAAPPTTAQRFRATLVWMAEAPLALNRPYLVKHTTQQVCAEVVRLISKLEIETLEVTGPAPFEMNDIGTVEIETHRPLFCDPYEENRATGGFVLIDPAGNQTLAAGMIRGAVAERQPEPRRLGQRGLTIWFTGLSASGKTTLSRALYERLWAMGHKVHLLDGDDVRRNICKDLGFSKEDRDENIRRIGFVADLLTKNGVIVLVSAISPYRAVREEVRGKIGDFVEIYVNAPLEVCEQRDVKGLYRRARAGQLHGFTGIDDPYEAPSNPEVECRTDRETVAESVEKILRYLGGALESR